MRQWPIQSAESIFIRSDHSASRQVGGASTRNGSERFERLLPPGLRYLRRSGYLDNRCGRQPATLSVTVISEMVKLMR
jgi:hypothetical protein